MCFDITATYDLLADRQSGLPKSISLVESCDTKRTFTVIRIANFTAKPKRLIIGNMFCGVDCVLGAKPHNFAVNTRSGRI